MPTLRVEAAMLRAMLPDLVLREGMQVVASVVERAGQKGIIMLAGVPLAAQLPDNVKTGDVLRMIVAETGSERVVLRISDAQQAPQAQAPTPTVGVPLPNGTNAHVAVAERDAGGARGAGASSTRSGSRLPRPGSATSTCTWSSPATRCCASTCARAGAAFELAERHAAELQTAVATASGKPAQVLVSARHDPFETYA
jgi:hypothetical protein